MEKDKGRKETVKFEIKIRKANNPRWRADPYKATSLDEVRRHIANVITKHGRLNKGAYQLSLKYRGGYGKNEEDGRTWVINWEGTAERAIEIFTEYIKTIEEDLIKKN